MACSTPCAAGWPCDQSDDLAVADAGLPELYCALLGQVSEFLVEDDVQAEHHHGSRVGGDDLLEDLLDVPLAPLAGEEVEDQAERAGWRPPGQRGGLSW
eukprot:10012840-Lingulodinium_polyedra.AAC.1